MCRIKVNGTECSVADHVTYEDVVRLAGMRGVPSMTVKRAGGAGASDRIVHPGDVVDVVDGTVFNVAHTGNA